VFSVRLRTLGLVSALLTLVFALAAVLIFNDDGNATTEPGAAGGDSSATPQGTGSSSPSAAKLQRPAVPATGKFYVGVDAAPVTVTRFNQEVDIAQPAILGGYVSKGGALAGVLAEVRNLPDTAPMVSWAVDFTKPLSDGSQDEYLEQQAQVVAAYAKPVFIRLDWEMNTTWQDGWSEPHVSTARYIANWRHVVEVFHQQGAANAAFVWCPNIGQWNDDTFRAWYPGDSFVDWIGADAYPHQTAGNNVLTEPGGLNQIAVFGAAHGKPAMLAEWGVTSPDPDTAWLFDLVFEWADRYPRTVKALVYFDYVGTTGDHLLLHHPNGAAEFKYLISSHPGALTSLSAAGSK
jgi:Glycosyl hydrolase family 26